jgi:hypothetical protein
MILMSPCLSIMDWGEMAPQWYSRQGGGFDIFSSLAQSIVRGGRTREPCFSTLLTCSGSERWVHHLSVCEVYVRIDQVLIDFP